MNGFVSDLLVIILACMTLAFPKPTKRKRRRRRIAQRAKFKLYDNPLKSYRLVPSDQLIQWANEKRAIQLANPTPACEEFAAILRNLAIAFEREFIFFRPGSFIIADFYCRDPAIVFEIDGSAHDCQRGYDIGRDRWLESTHGIRTVRLPNRKIFREREYVERLVKRACGS